MHINVVYKQKSAVQLSPVLNFWKSVKTEEENDCLVVLKLQNS